MPIALIDDELQRWLGKNGDFTDPCNWSSGRTPHNEAVMIGPEVVYVGDTEERTVADSTD